ncbi:MAG TPA: hypothetical protein VL486_14645 [Verrucomicrobiae bacterium]|nr:hypothetical protein [Verrucomicrobiae bacterium]
MNAVFAGNLPDAVHIRAPWTGSIMLGDDSDAGFTNTQYHDALGNGEPEC